MGQLMMAFLGNSLLNWDVNNKIELAPCIVRIGKEQGWSWNAYCSEQNKEGCVGRMCGQYQYCLEHLLRHRLRASHSRGFIQEIWGGLVNVHLWQVSGWSRWCRHHTFEPSMHLYDQEQMVSPLRPWWRFWLLSWVAGYFLTWEATGTH